MYYGMLARYFSVDVVAATAAAPWRYCWRDGMLFFSSATAAIHFIYLYVLIFNICLCRYVCVCVIINFINVSECEPKKLEAL